MDINTCAATTEGIRDLALYAHIIPSAAIVLLALFVLWKAPNRKKAWVFSGFCAAFAAWLLSALVIWTTNDYYLVAALWAPIDYVEIVFFLLLFWFVCIDLYPDALPRWLPAYIALAALPPLVITLAGRSVLGLDQTVCEMTNNEFVQNYKLALEVLTLTILLVLGIRRLLQKKGNGAEQTRISLVVSSVVLFLGIFSGSEYVASYSGVYEINLYALFTLPVFVLLLTIAITSYGMFKLGDTAVKALFYVFLVLAATQFFSVQSLTDFLLASMSFGVILTLGIMLFRSNEREIEAERSLVEVNKQQEGLLHFISHEIKGYLTKNEAGFAAIKDGDFGEVPAPLKTMAESALADTRKGVETVMDILDASNLKKGTMSYGKKEFDLCRTVEEVVSDLQPEAAARHLVLRLHKGAPTCLVNGDEEKIRRHVIRNIIDNSIKYTREGRVDVEISRANGITKVTVRDTGVGITPEDMKRLFTEGGHGAESIKVNVHSTGYGLFIAKAITEAHGGKIRAESDGAGKGSRFIIELPTA